MFTLLLEKKLGKDLMKKLLNVIVYLEFLGSIKSIEESKL